MRVFLYIICTLFIIIYLSCYESPFSSEDEDLLENVNLQLGWIKSKGIMLDATTESFAPGEISSYFLYFNNLVSYSTFEDATSATDFGNWMPSSPSAPEIYEVTTDILSGNKYLYLYLNRSGSSQYFYHPLTLEATTDYAFIFDYSFIDGAGTLQLSFGENTDDQQKAAITPSVGGIHKGRFDFTTAQASSNYQIRFGYSNNDAADTYKAYLDNIVLFLKGANSISKRLNIAGSGEPAINDGTAKDFYEGYYRLEIYAKKGTSNYITLKIGSQIETFPLYNSWVKYSVETYIFKENGYLYLEILPATQNEIDRFPGGIYIANPHLYFIGD